MNPKTSTVSALTTSEYRYCASSGVSPLKPPNEVRPLLPSTPRSATAAIRPSVRSINSARCAGSLAIPSAASTSAVSSSSQRRSAFVISCSSPFNRNRVSDGSGGIDRPTSTTWSRRGPSRHSSSRSPVATGSEISSTPSHTTTVGRSSSPSPGNHACASGGAGSADSGRDQWASRRVRRRSGPSSRLSSESHTTSEPTDRTHCATAVVLPLPTGPDTSVTRASRDAPNRAVRRRLRTSCRGDAGISSPRGTRAYPLHWARQPHRGGSVRRPATGREPGFGEFVVRGSAPRAAAQCARSVTERSDSCCRRPTPTPSSKPRAARGGCT